MGHKTVDLRLILVTLISGLGTMVFPGSAEARVQKALPACIEYMRSHRIADDLSPEMECSVPLTLNAFSTTERQAGFSRCVEFMAMPTHRTFESDVPYIACGNQRMTQIFINSASATQFERCWNFMSVHPMRESGIPPSISCQDHNRLNQFTSEEVRLGFRRCMDHFASVSPRLLSRVRRASITCTTPQLVSAFERTTHSQIAACLSEAGPFTYESLRRCEATYGGAPEVPPAPADAANQKTTTGSSASD